MSYNSSKFMQMYSYRKWILNMLQKKCKILQIIMIKNTLKSWLLVMIKRVPGAILGFWHCIGYKRTKLGLFM